MVTMARIKNDILETCDLSLYWKLIMFINNDKFQQQNTITTHSGQKQNFFIEIINKKNNWTDIENNLPLSIYSIKWGNTRK